MRDDVLIIICSTPNSRRLPRKCFLKIAGKPVLQHIFDRLKPLDIPVVLAIPEGTYSEYHSYFKFQNFTYYEGNAESPLHRMVGCLLGMRRAGINPKYIIRITHDDILIDSLTIRELLQEVINQKAGYGITPTIVDGAGAEVIATENILNALQKHPEPVEHISYFVKGENCPNPKIIEMRPRPSIERKARLTLDYYEDYVVLETILREVGPEASVDEICLYLDENPQILDYNRLPTYTIYTCVKNGVKWIDGNVRHSLLCTDIERLIIDDCSTDKTLSELLRSTNTGYRVIINEENIGLASSSNIAISKAKGKYIMRVDVDDIVKPQAFEQMSAKMEAEGSVICYANYTEVNEDGVFIRDRENVDAKEKHHIGCALVNKRWLNEIRFKEGIRHWDGLELYNRIKGRFPISYVEEPLWYYRVRKDSMSRTNLEERERCKPDG